MALLLIPSISLSQPINFDKPIHAMGVSRCSVWLKDYSSHQIILQWLKGYLTAYAVTQDHSVLDGSTDYSLSQVVDNYCRKKPSEDFFDAAWAIAGDLSSANINKAR